jgi:hypothetical protein
MSPRASESRPDTLGHSNPDPARRVRRPRPEARRSLPVRAYHHTSHGVQDTAQWRPSLPRKLLAGLVAVTVAYIIGYGHLAGPPEDLVEAFCARMQPGMPVVQVRGEANAAALGITLGDEVLQICRLGPDASGRCHIDHRNGFVRRVTYTPLAQRR